MSEFSNGLTPGQAERLVFALEEMGEALQAIGKIMRHGYESKHPYVENGVTNRGALEYELGHVSAAMILLITNNDLDHEALAKAREDKLVMVKRWLHHA